MAKYIFTNYPGVQCIFSEGLAQDPLERFFGLQRQMGGGCTAPNVWDGF